MQSWQQRTLNPAKPFLNGASTSLLTLAPSGGGGVSKVPSPSAMGNVGYSQMVPEETRFHHVGQPGLKLLTSGDPPTSASQSIGLQA
ncbi:hypothetical protein AAY473_015607 [Plecturocebus cupreus]